MEQLIINNTNLGAPRLLKEYVLRTQPNIEILDGFATHDTKSPECKMYKKIYTCNEMYIMLHNRLPHVRYNGNELYELYRLSQSEDLNSYLMFRNIAERMPIMYAPFIKYCSDLKWAKRFVLDVNGYQQQWAHQMYLTEIYGPSFLKLQPYNTKITAALLKRKIFRPASPEIKTFLKIALNEEN